MEHLRYNWYRQNNDLCAFFLNPALGNYILTIIISIIDHQMSQIIVDDDHCNDIKHEDIA